MSENIILTVGVEGTGQGEQKIKSLKAQLKEMKNELLGLDEGSERFKKLSKEAGQLEDRIGDVNQRVRALSSDTKKLDALVGVGSAIAGGFQAAQGAMALFGSNSKAVEKAIQNIIAVQGVLNGVQQVANFLTTEGIGKDIASAVAKGYNATKTALLTAAQWALNAAMTANPIGLIIAGLVALGAGIAAVIKWYDKLILIAKAWLGIFDVQAMKEAQLEKERADRRTKEGKAHQQRLDEIEKEKNAKIAATDKTISALELEKDTLEAQGKSSDAVTIKILEAEKEKTIAVLEANRLKLQSWIDYYSNLQALSGKSTEDFKLEMKGRGVDLDILQQKANELITQNEYAVQKSENNITRFKREQSEKRNQTTKDEVKADDDERQKAFEAEMERQRMLIEQRNDALQQIVEAENEYQDSLLSKQEQELNAVNDKYFQLIESAKQYGIDTAILEEARLAELDRINGEYRDAAIKEEERKEKEAADIKKKIQQDYTQSVVNLMSTVFTLSNRFGKQDDESKEKRAKRQFAINKALQLGLAVMDGYKAVTASLAQSPVAIGPVPNPAGIASLAFAVTTSLANIAKIAATKYESTGANLSTSTPNTGAGESVSNVGNTTPNVNAIPGGSTLLNQEPQKVVVVESDITKTQKKVSAIEAIATIG
jgi:hypothetical protein